VRDVCRHIRPILGQAKMGSSIRLPALHRRSILGRERGPKIGISTPARGNHRAAGATPRRSDEHERPIARARSQQAADPAAANNQVLGALRDRRLSVPSRAWSRSVKGPDRE
jgi:hypothetical protein